MKRIVILLELYRKNLLAVLLVLLLMTCSLFYMIELFGYLRYQTYSLRQLEKMGFSDGVYVMAADGFDQWEKNQTSTYDEVVSQDFPAVNMIINPSYSYSNWNGYSVNIVVCDQSFIENFSFSDQGEWFSNDTHTPSQVPEIVVGGFLFSDISVGDTIQLYERSDDGNILSYADAYVIGKDNEPTMAFDLGYTASSVAADKLFTNCNNIIYMTQESLLRLKGYDDSNKHNNFIITFQTNASSKEKQEVLDYLTQKGRYVTFDEIRSFSQEDISTRLRSDLPRPLFLLGISIFSMISISVLLTEKQMKDYLIYYLVGYNRRKSFCNTFVGIMGIGLIAGSINLTYLFWLNQNFILLKGADYVKYHNYLVLDNALGIILIFIISTSFLSSLIPFTMLQKNSPIDIYRRSL